MSIRRLIPVILLASMFGYGCQKAEEAPVEAPVEAPAEAAAEVAPTSDPACVGVFEAGTAETIKIGDVEWELNGATLKQITENKEGELRIGVLTDIKDASEGNIANLKKFAKWFTAKKVNFVVVAGDTGENAGDIVKALSTLAELNVPVLNIIGNRENIHCFDKALATLKETSPNFFNLNQIRLVDTGIADIVSMPGYFNPSFIHADKGCPYYPADVAATGEIVAKADSKVILVSHGSFKQDGAEGIDRTSENANVGDPELTKLVKEKAIPFGIFGNIHEAGGRAVNFEGTKVLAQGEAFDALYLNAGPVDSVRWTMNDESTSDGMAALMTVKDGKASYEIKRCKGVETAAAAPAAKPDVKEGKKAGKPTKASPKKKMMKAGSMEKAMGATAAEKAAVAPTTGEKAKVGGAKKLKKSMRKAKRKSRVKIPGK